MDGAVYEPGAGETWGSFVVEAARPVSLRPIGFDVIAFARAGAQVSLHGGVGAMVDPVAAAWCGAGSTSRWEAIDTPAVRIDWFRSQPLEPPWIRGPSRLGLYYSPSRQFLRLRLLTLGGSSSGSVLAGGAEGACRMALETARWRPVATDRPGASRLAESVRRYLASNFRGSASVPQIARRIASSPAHMSRELKRHTGLSVLSYRHELRMRAALERLDDEATALVDLALGLGYSSHSHFTEKFKLTFGMTPTGYRRLMSGHGSVAQWPALRSTASSSR